MLALSFQVGTLRFALPCREVVEVVPLPRLRPVVHAPPLVAGLFDYRGVPTPVIDLCQLMHGHPCVERLSSRVIMVKWRDRALGLLAERVTDAFEVDEQRVASSGVALPAAPYLDGVLLAGDGSGAMTQLIVPARLLTDEVRALLEAE